MTSIFERLNTNRRIPPPRRGPSSRLASRGVRSNNGLRFSDMLLLLVLALAYLFAMSTPLLSIKLHVSGYSHLPFLLLVPIIVLQLIGRSVNNDVPPWARVLGITWPLVLLALFALGGSMVAKWELRIEDTYLTFALYLLLLPLYVAAVPGHPALAASWVRALAVLWIGFAAAALLGEAARFGATEALHEIEYIVISGFFLLYHLAHRRWLKVLAVLCIVAASLLNHKLTGYIIALMALTQMAVFGGWRRLLPRWRGAYAVAAAVAVVVLASIVVGLYFEFRQQLPSGNSEVRLAQYRIAWARFVDSPIWGSAYTDGSGEVYTEFVRALNIPTHSDLLDLLKHGGLIALGLFLWGYWNLWTVVRRAAALVHDQHLLRVYFQAVGFFQWTALITFAINPLLLRGPYLIVIWGNLGLAAGVALAVLRSQGTAAAASARTPLTASRLRPAGSR